MKRANTILIILIMMLICCSCSIGQPSSGIGVKGTISNDVPGILGIINNGASVYPNGEISNAKIYLGGITGANIWRREFICNSMSACGMYPYGQRDNGDGAIVNLGGIRSGANVFPSHVKTVALRRERANLQP